LAVCRRFDLRTELAAAAVLRRERTMRDKHVALPSLAVQAGRKPTIPELLQQLDCLHSVADAASDFVARIRHWFFVEGDNSPYKNPNDPSAIQEVWNAAARVEREFYPSPPKEGRCSWWAADAVIGIVHWQRFYPAVQELMRLYDKVLKRLGWFDAHGVGLRAPVGWDAASVVMEGALLRTFEEAARHLDSLVSKARHDYQNRHVSAGVQGPRAPLLKIAKPWCFAVGAVGVNDTVTSAEPLARETLGELEKLASALLSPARTLSDATTPISAHHALVMFRPALDALAKCLTERCCLITPGCEGVVQPPCNYPMAAQTGIMRLAEITLAAQEWDARHPEGNLRDALPAELVASLDRVLSDLRAAQSPRVAPVAPPNGLEVLPGGIRYGEVTVELSGKPLACISEIVDAHGQRLDAERLRERVWGRESYTEISTVKNAVADARDALRKLARLAGIPIDKHFDPLPCVDRGKNLAWKLAFPG
jgi:hypothetical protein